MELFNFNDYQTGINSMIITNNIQFSLNEYIANTNLAFIDDNQSDSDDNFASICSTYLHTDLFNQNSFIEILENFNEIPEQSITNMNTNQLNMNAYSSSQALPSVANLLSETRVIDNVILNNNHSSKTLPSKQNQSILFNPTINQNQSTSVTPVLHLTDPNLNTRLVTVEMPIDLIKSQKIEILSPPRQFYRPRTQNESKHSSHYIRCEDSALFDYPTIKIRQEWAIQSSMNFIEVALVDIQKHPHPYTLDNKTSQISFEDGGLIIKQNEPNILYFRLTNEDFLKSSKTFQMELVKSKQDETITKKLIRLRNLEQSMLRFTRFYVNEQGLLQKDFDSEEYSGVMIESYGEIAVEHVSPRYSPMRGQELMFISLKGRFVKDDINVFIGETKHCWCQQITKLFVNGNFIYFNIPAFPHSQVGRIHATVNVYFKKQLIHRSNFLYHSLLDQEFNANKSDLNTLMTPNDVNCLQMNILTMNDSIPSIVKSKSKTKSRKRLNS